MRYIIKIKVFSRSDLFIRNQWSRYSGNSFSLINIGRQHYYDKIEYKLCLMGFELAWSIDLN